MLVLDASVVVKWLLPASDPEEDVSGALALLEAVRNESVALLQPPHWLAEVAGVVARVSPATAEAQVSALHELRLPQAAGADVYTLACRLSITLDHHLFDTLYHAVALANEGVTLVTADRRYYSKASKLGRVQLLEAETRDS